jgi:hypothetical protein
MRSSPRERNRGSDIHFHKGSGGVYDGPDADLRNEIEIDILALKERLGRPIDYILVSGDIAFSGKRACAYRLICGHRGG